jgi:hypothetical protein
MWASRLSIRLEGPDWVEEKKRRRGESVGIEAKEFPDLGISPGVRPQTQLAPLE